MGRQRTNQTVVDAPSDDQVHDDRATKPPAADRRAGVVVRIEARPDAATRASWDRLVSRTPGSDVAQLSSWGALRQRAGYAPLFIVASVGDQFVGGAMVLHRRLMPGLGSLAYLPLGPVLPAGACHDQTMDVVCDAIADLGRHRFAAMFVQPMAGDQGVSDRLQRRGFRPSTAGIAPAASIAIDLSEPHSGLRSGTRASIKRAAHHGVQVRRASVADLPAVAGLLADTARHHGFPAASLDYLRSLHEALTPGDHLQIFLAERDGTPLAADVLTGSGGVLTLRLTGMRRDQDTRKIGAAAMLRWETMVWARANGYDTLDLGGISPAAVDAIRAGHAGLTGRVDGRTYFKASFGGQAYHRPTAVELLSSTPVRFGYDLIRRSPHGGQLLRTAKQLLRDPRHRR
jgi:lipid II:glycine glycyltransferase (peptidoglycan interpeptide bridge formation enzyme)